MYASTRESLVGIGVDWVAENVANLWCGAHLHPVHDLTPALERLLLAHQIVGYPLVFIVAPLALASFAGRPPHRQVGVAYLVGMSALYVTGSVLTFTQYPYASWEFGRNVTFNLAGILYALQGARAIWLWRNADAPRPTALDHVLRALFVATIAVMFALAVQKNTALRVFSLIGIGMLALDRADFRAGLTKAVLYARHVRMILASYFYILTVVSLVHLREEATANVRWLWPTAAGLFVVWVVHGSVTPGNAWRTKVQRSVILATVLLTLSFGAYVAYEVSRDGLRRPSPPPEAARDRG
jgi:hypothetical protein